MDGMEWSGTSGVAAGSTASNGTREATLSHMQFLRLAIDTLAIRVTRWVTLVMAFGLFALAAWRPDWLRLAAAAGFTILVYLPLLYAKRG